MKYQEFYEDSLPGWAMPGAYDVVVGLCNHLRHDQRRTKYRLNFIPIAQLFRDYIKDENLMARRKRGSENGSDGSTTQSVGQSPLRWCNVSLSDSDAAVLEREEPGLEQMGASLIGMALENDFDVTLKRLPSGECMCAIVGNDPFVSGGRVGLSAFASNYPDATKALLYKWFDKLGTAWPEPHSTVARRFR